MEYLFFTYPNCSKCGELKKLLEEISLKGQEYSLIFKESKLKIREYLKDIKRDDKGAIIIPTLILQDDGRAIVVLNNRKELEDWLKLRA
ncbi:MAG: hypothetical protein ACETWK_11450 [Candidatus Aminicenantaceae bacterium]